jgi:hypothetical protein
MNSNDTIIGGVSLMERRREIKHEHGRPCRSRGCLGRSRGCVARRWAVGRRFVLVVGGMLW